MSEFKSRPLTARAYALHHLHALKHGWRQLSRTPLASSMTIAVLSIALLLPSALLVLLNNTQQLTSRWQDSANVSVFLQVGLNDQQAQQTWQVIRARADVKQADYISAEQGLQQFKQNSGLSNALDALPQNPLPGVITVIPKDPQLFLLQQMRAQFSQLPGVDHVQFDTQWLRRLFSIVDLSKNVVYGLFALLALTVLLIIGNTIRMSVAKYQHEIRVLKLVGATNAFIRRPFLYSGVLYGCAAGIVAIVLLMILLSLLQGSVQQLADLYDSQFTLHNLSFSSGIGLLWASIMLGYLGSWLVVGRHLGREEWL